MKSNVLSTFVGLGLVASLGIACGDSGSSSSSGGSGEGGNVTTTGGQGGGGAAGTGGDGGVTPVGGAGGTGGQTTGDGNDSFAEAIDLEPNKDLLVAEGDLDPAEDDADFFKFTSTGEPIQILVNSRAEGDEFAEGYIDTVLTVYNSAEEQVAQNDDPFPRNSLDSSVNTILPAGEYFLKVEEFCHFAAGSCPDGYFDDISETAYIVAVVPQDPTLNSVFPEAAEPNSAVANASVMEYEAASEGVYYLSINYGEFGGADPADGVRFTVPADVDATDSRISANFYIPPAGSNGNGSSAKPGIVSIASAAEPTSIIAKLDFTDQPEDPNRADMTMPVLPGGEYIMWINSSEAATAADGIDPFYFALHSVNSGNPLEDDANNNAFNASQTLTAASATQYFVEGDVPVGDNDYFTIPALGDFLNVACSSSAMGAGSTLEIDIRTAADVSLASDSEGPTGIFLPDTDVAGQASLVVHISNGGQAADVTGAFYRCGFNFADEASQ